MRRVIYFVVALVIWIFLAWPFVDGGIDKQSMIAGLVASLVVAVLFHEMLPREHHVFISPVRLLWFLVYVPVFFYYMIIANFDDWPTRLHLRPVL